MPNHSRVFAKQPVRCNNSIRFRKITTSTLRVFTRRARTDKQSLATDPHSALTPRDLNSRQFVPTFVPCHVTAMHKKIFIVTSILCNTPVQQTNLIHVTMASFYAAMSDDHSKMFNQNVQALQIWIPGTISCNRRFIEQKSHFFIGMKKSLLRK